MNIEVLYIGHCQSHEKGHLNEQASGSLLERDGNRAEVRRMNNS